MEDCIGTELLRTRLRFANYGMHLELTNPQVPPILVDTGPVLRAHVISRHEFTELHPAPGPGDVVLLAGSGFAWVVARDGSWKRARVRDLPSAQLSLAICALTPWAQRRTPR